MAHEVAYARFCDFAFAFEGNADVHESYCYSVHVSYACTIISVRVGIFDVFRNS